MLEKFHQYHLVEKLHKKYSHTTYLASPIDKPEYQVVLTVFASSLFRFPHEHENLLQKAQRIKRFQHPHLIPILDMGIEEEQPFVVREYFPNGSLRSRLKNLSPERLRLPDALNVVLQVGEALAYAHEYTIVHGNIKAENILFDANDRAVLTDFSLVTKNDAIFRDQTAEEYAFCYMAPEQFAGICDVRSDQYALGCLTYELIAGRLPFAAQSLASMMGLPGRALPAPLSEGVAGLSPSLEAAVLKTLAKDPDERFFDFSLFLEIIRSILSPAPAFPLARPDHLYKNGTISRLVQAAEVKSPSSPVRRHATKRVVSEPSKESEVASSVEVERAEPEVTLSLSDTSMPESTGIIPPSEDLASHLQLISPLSEETNPVDNRVKEEETLNLLFADHFIEREKNTSSVLINSYSEYENNDYEIREIALAPNNSTEVYMPYPKRLRNSRRRVLERALFLSAIIALLVYIFWPPMMGISGTSLHTTNKKQLIIPQIPNISATLDPAPAIPIQTMPTAQPSVRATNISIIIATSKPALKPTLAPKPTPTPKPIPISYEAESSQNTLSGGAQVIGCADCSGGNRVGYIGLQSNSGNNGIIRFNNVKKDIAGNYTMTIYYTEGDSNGRIGYISVNGGSAITYTGSDTGSFWTVGTVNVVVNLSVGDNSITFSNPNSETSDIDKIVV